MSILPQLGERDRAVLHSIFNPSLPLGDESFFTTSEEPTRISHGDYENNRLNKDDKEIVELETSAIKHAEEKKFAESLEIFDKLLKLQPKRAATYNNRAQVYRLMGNVTDALADLSKAISFGVESGNAYQQALCQRGIIFKKDGKEDEAKSDFMEAAKQGNTFSKQQLIEMNPYAALCNQMLSKAMQQLEKK